MVDFRYAQFCPLTRAVEILGERWTILILRELFLGPKRFRELKDALAGISSSVLADRLTKLEEKGIVARRELEPPAAVAVYELDEAGRALQPLLVEMTRWGMRFLGSPDPDDTLRPEWLVLGLQVFARAAASDEIGAHLHVEGGAESVDIYVRGGAAGTAVSRTALPYDVSISAPPMEMLMFLTGVVSTNDPASVTIEGDARVARRISRLFEFQATPASPRVAPAVKSPEATQTRRPARGERRPAASRSRKGAAVS